MKRYQTSWVWLKTCICTLDAMLPLRRLKTCICCLSYYTYIRFKISEDGTLPPGRLKTYIKVSALSSMYVALPLDG
jgi:hypothetical protein